MAETKRMKVARATQKEINSLRQLLKDLECVGENYSWTDPYDAVKRFPDNFFELENMEAEDNETLLSGICEWFAENRWEVVLFNLDVLLDNCADLNAPTLEFNERIKKGLALLDSQPEPSASLTAKLASVLKRHGIEDGVDGIAEDLSRTVISCCDGGQETHDAVVANAEFSPLESECQAIASAVFKDSFGESIFPHDMHS